MHRATGKGPKPHLAARLPKALARQVSAARLISEVNWRWSTRKPGEPHGLPAPLVVSITSHPPRYSTLMLTLRGLLTQTVRPDRIVLWLTREEQAALPAVVSTLPGLEIETAPQIRSFKKIIPALTRYSECFIAIADDDAYYPRTWLEELTSEYAPDQRMIACHRAHEVALTQDGGVAPYAAWRRIVTPECSPLVFATGIGGVLYPPRSLDGEALDAAAFTTHCPTNDDAWLYWMARRAGWRFSKIGYRSHFACWPGSQRVALQHVNAGGGNDAQIRSLIERYGFPAIADPERNEPPLTAKSW